MGNLDYRMPLNCPLMHTIQANHSVYEHLRFTFVYLKKVASVYKTYYEQN